MESAIWPCERGVEPRVYVTKYRHTMIPVMSAGRDSLLSKDREISKERVETAHVRGRKGRRPKLKVQRAYSDCFREPVLLSSADDTWESVRPRFCAYRYEKELKGSSSLR